MSRTLAALVLTYNEAPMLEHTLPALKKCVDEVIVVDMLSNDGSADLFQRLLDGRDKVVRYPRENLFAYGFSHPRNYGASFSEAEWLLAVDADELVEPDSVNRWREQPTDGPATLHVKRKNYLPDPTRSLADIGGILASDRLTEEHPTRLYRNLPSIQWRGMIHEEVWKGDQNGWVENGRVDITYHHLNAFKPPSDEIEKHKLYYYLTLKAAAFPSFRYGTNEYWFTEFPRPRLDRMLSYADAFCHDQGLPRLPHAQVRSKLGII